MSNFMKSIYEHLKTRKKYNTLKLKYEVLQEDYEKKVVELNTERRVHIKRQEVWEQKLKEQEDEIIRLKRRKYANSNSKEKQNKKS